MPLHELQQRMSSAEFSLHMELAAMDRDQIEHRNAPTPTAEELEWFGGAT